MFLVRIVTAFQNTAVGHIFNDLAWKTIIILNIIIGEMVESSANEKGQVKNYDIHFAEIIRKLVYQMNAKQNKQLSIIL